MLKKRIIPKLQLKARKMGSQRRLVLVTTVEFNNVVEIGDPVSQAKIFQAQAADELVFLDLDASSENRNTLIDIIRKAAEEVFMPFVVGGGVKTEEDFRILLSNGADKVSINTAAIETPDLINNAANRFGKQCVVVSIDYKKDVDGNYNVFIRGGKEKTILDPVSWASECEKRGAGEILITAIDNDGKREGLNNDLCSEISEKVSIPVITAGGCGLASHFIDGFRIGKADAVSAGTFFCFQDQNPMQTRAHIKNADIPIRIFT